MLVHFEDVDIQFLDDGRERGLDCRGNDRAETALDGFGQIAALRFPLNAVHRTDKLKKELPRIGHLHVHRATRAQFQRNTGVRVDVTHLRIRAPLECHLNGFVDEIHLTVERRSVLPGEAAKDMSNHRDVLGLQRVTPGAEGVKRLAVHEEYRFLRFMDDELRQAVEVLAGVFPDEGAVVAFIFDKLCNFHGVVFLPLASLNGASFAIGCKLWIRYMGCCNNAVVRGKISRPDGQMLPGLLAGQFISYSKRMD